MVCAVHLRLVEVHVCIFVVLEDACVYDEAVVELCVVEFEDALGVDAVHSAGVLESIALGLLRVAIGILMVDVHHIRDIGIFRYEFVRGFGIV